MKKAAVKKTTGKIININTKLSENQKDFNNVIAASEKIKKDLKQLKSKMILFENYLKPHLTIHDNFSLDKIISKLQNMDATEQHQETDDGHHSCEMCSPTSIESIDFIIKYTVLPTIYEMEGVNIATGTKFKDTQQCISKQPEKNREILRKIIIIEIRNEGVEKMILRMTERLKKMEKQADKLIIKKNKEEHKKNKGKKIIKLVN